jgi:hypothetical protein
VHEDAPGFAPWLLCEPLDDRVICGLSSRATTNVYCVPYCMTGLPEGVAEAAALEAAAAAATAEQRGGGAPSRATLVLCGVTALLAAVAVPSFAALPYFALVLVVLLAWGFETHSGPRTARNSRRRRRRYSFNSDQLTPRNTNGSPNPRRTRSLPLDHRRRAATRATARPGRGGVASGLTVFPMVPHSALQLLLCYAVAGRLFRTSTRPTFNILLRLLLRASLTSILPKLISNPQPRTDRVLWAKRPQNRSDSSEMAQNRCTGLLGSRNRIGSA